jgi:hypothetical protein
MISRQNLRIWGPEVVGLLVVFTVGIVAKRSTAWTPCAKSTSEQSTNPSRPS